MSAPAHATTRAIESGSLRDRWKAGVTCNAVVFAFSVSLIWLAFYNARFWQDTVQAMWHGNAASAVFLVSLFALVWCAQALLLLLVPRRFVLGLASVLFVVAAVSSFFAVKYGVVMNKEMMRNVLETDSAEAGALVSSVLIGWVILLGVLPAILVWRVRLPDLSWHRALRQRAFAFGGIGIACTIAVLACSASYAVFLREHKPLRYAVLPAAPLTSLIGLLADEHRHAHTGPPVDPGGKVQRLAALSPQKPLVVFLVVGETARAANFQLGGYDRLTNPGLSAIDDLVYFPRTFSCGTSTAVSVPCLFSHLGREDFSVSDARHFTNLLDVMVKAGLDVEWRDNNSGCKGVCARVRTETYSSATDAADCKGSNCYDDVMLKDLASRLNSVRRDTVIVFHQVGSHGPAYSERYPPGSAPFQPACHSNQLDRCSTQEIVNAYDNSIAYTDSILTRQISALRDADAHVDSLLLYVSDHGESLGEQGIYLHGLPYSFAPAVQRQVPMLLWLSPGYQHRTALDMRCLRDEAGGGTFSHDNFYHTALGAVDVRNAVYDARLDILASCRNKTDEAQHAQRSVSSSKG